MEVKVVRLAGSGELPLPSYASEKSAGLDLYAAIEENLLIQPGSWSLVSTGIAIELPDGYEAQIRSRSGLAAKFGIVVLNSPGTIDADYRGEIKVILANLGRETYTIARGDRIAQMVIAPVVRAELMAAESISETARSDGGFGSTGK